MMSTEGLIDLDRPPEISRQPGSTHRTTTSNRSREWACGSTPPPTRPPAPATSARLSWYKHQDHIFDWGLAMRIALISLLAMTYHLKVQWEAGEVVRLEWRDGADGGV